MMTSVETILFLAMVSVFAWFAIYVIRQDRAERKEPK
jgi:preprotein translocase subunit YajC